MAQQIFIDAWSFRKTGIRFPDHALRLLEFGVATVRPGIDALLENSRRLEHHHAPRRDRHLLAGLRISADALTFLAHHERTEGRQLHRFAALETIGDFLENQL